MFDDADYDFFIDTPAHADVNKGLKLGPNTRRRRESKLASLWEMWLTDLRDNLESCQEYCDGEKYPNGRRRIINHDVYVAATLPAPRTAEKSA